MSKMSQIMTGMCVGFDVSQVKLRSLRLVSKKAFWDAFETSSNTVNYTISTRIVVEQYNLISKYFWTNFGMD